MAEHKNLYVAGIDIGSLTSKAIILNKEKEVVCSEITRSGHDAQRVAAKLMSDCLKKAGIAMDDIAYIVGTGYGRVSIDFADRSVTEISCHAKGVTHIFPGAGTIVDIGGQDSKVISVSVDGSIAQFILNDKCAAGTGRFFEVMASALDVPLDEMGDMAARATKRCHVSNTCTVFAESEVIGLMVHGIPKEWIIAGICESVASRVYGMMVRTRMEEDFVMTGGVAKNKGVVKILAEKTGKEFLTSEQCQFTGALGGALIALSYAGSDARKGRASLRV